MRELLNIKRQETFQCSIKPRLSDKLIICIIKKILTVKENIPEGSDE